MSSQCIHCTLVNLTALSANCARVMLQVDLSDCNELGDATCRCLSDGQPGYAVNGGTPSLRCLPAFLSLVSPCLFGNQLTSRCKLQSLLHQAHFALCCAVLCCAVLCHTNFQFTLIQCSADDVRTNTMFMSIHVDIGMFLNMFMTLSGRFFVHFHVHHSHVLLFP